MRKIIPKPDVFLILDHYMTCRQYQVWWGKFKSISVNFCGLFTINVSSKRLIITMKSPVQEETHHNVGIKEQDLISYYEEADYMIPHQISLIIDEETSSHKSPLWWYRSVWAALIKLHENQLVINKTIIDAFTKDNKLFNINKSVAANTKVIPSLIALNALVGCVSVPMMLGRSKSNVLKTVNKVSLKYVGDVDANLEEVMWEGNQFVAKCYGKINRACLKIDAQFVLPVLKSLPPTNEVLKMNIKWAYYAAVMWKNCVTSNPPKLNQCEYGWERNEGDKSLRPTMIPAGIKIALNEILQMTICKCASI